MFDQSTLGMSQSGGMPFSPPMGNRWSGSFPMGRALPTKPNPLARALPVQQNKADIGGIQQAMAKRGSCGEPHSVMKRSPAGEGGLKYKVDKDADSKGEEAFNSLDNYMKKAGLNSFQASFFGRLIEHGMDESAIRNAVKQANARFGVKVAEELNQGMDKLGFTALFNMGRAVLPALSRAGQNVTQFVRGTVGRNATKALDAYPPSMAALQNAKSPAWRAGTAVNQGAKNVRDFASGARQYLDPSITSNALNPSRSYVAGSKAIQELVNNPLGSAKNVFTGPGARQGAWTGLINPYTGIASGNAFDEEGNLNLSGLAASTLAGTLGGRALGRMGGNVLDTANKMSKKMIGGSVAGGTAGLVGQLAGVPGIDPVTGAQLGGLAAFAPNRLAKIPGLKQIAQNKNTPEFIRKGLYGQTDKVLGELDPISLAYRVAKPKVIGAYNYAKANPLNAGAAVALGGAGLGGAGLGYAASRIPEAIQSGIEGAGQNMLQSPEIQNRLKNLDNAVNEGRNLFAQGRNTLTNVDNIAKPFTGENGQPNIIGGLLNTLGLGGGQTGQFLQDNQHWLIPALLGGLGMGGGYMMGGGTGATIGGIGLPLVHALLSQSMGNNGEQRLAQRELGHAAATAVPNEIERQKAQQQELQDQMRQRFAEHAQ